MVLRLAAALAACTLAGGCFRTGTPGCPAPDPMPAGIRVQQGGVTGEAAEGVGTLVIRASRATDRHATVQNAIVSLHAHPRELHVHLRRSATDSTGLVRWDWLPAGTYTLSAAAIGHDVLRAPVAVRAGYADTVQVHLRGRTWCVR
jgi:hypothetical protein